MFFVFVVAVLVLAMIGLASVLGTSVAWIGAIFLLPLLLLKVAFVVMMFGFIGRRMAGKRGGGWDWHESRWEGRPRPGRRRPEPSSEREERFEEWHRMAHARDEVDGWVADIDGSERE